MPTSAGFQLLAGRIPGERIATTVAEADSSSFTTTETEIDTVTAPLVDGRTYRIRWGGAVATTVANTTVLVRLREDDTAGATHQQRNFYIPITSSAGIGMDVEVEFTAATTGDQVFALTGLRNGGTGTLTGTGAAGRPRYLYVEYISG